MEREGGRRTDGGKGKEKGQTEAESVEGRR